MWFIVRIEAEYFQSGNPRHIVLLYIGYYSQEEGRDPGIIRILKDM